MKIGVVIQGPLITYGQGPNNSLNGFNCYSAIKKNIETIKRHNFCYVLSTWESATNEHLQILEQLERDDISLMILKVPSVFDPDHRYKQHFGILAGAEGLLCKNEGITHLLKIRTDMVMPEIFWEWVYKQSLVSERLCVSELMNVPFYMGDFVYFASKNQFLAFLKNITSYKSFIYHPMIAIDMGIKYRNFKLDLKNRRCCVIKKIKYAWQLIFCGKEISDYWSKFVYEHLEIMPECIWNEIEWRGRTIHTFLDSKKFKFESAMLYVRNRGQSNLAIYLNAYKSRLIKIFKILITQAYRFNK